MAEIIDGKKIASEVLDEVREQVSAMSVKPGLAAILVGDDPASASYVRGKQGDAAKCGMVSTLHDLPADCPAERLASVIAGCNDDPSVHGILLQLPLPKHLRADTFVDMIASDKDVDALTLHSHGLLAQGRPRFLPCTPAGVQQMLIRTGISTAGQHVVVVGRSNLVGRPLSILLSLKGDGANATVTLCHTGTRDLASFTKQADILVVAAGVTKAIGAEHVSPGVVVIDVGINPAGDRKLVGDVDFEAVAPIARAITPVPGGVGPMTRAMLMSNTLRAASGA